MPRNSALNRSNSCSGVRSCTVTLASLSLDSRSRSARTSCSSSSARPMSHLRLDCVQHSLRWSLQVTGFHHCRTPILLRLSPEASPATRVEHVVDDPRSPLRPHLLAPRAGGPSLLASSGVTGGRPSSYSSKNARLTKSGAPRTSGTKSPSSRAKTAVMLWLRAHDSSSPVSPPSKITRRNPVTTVPRGQLVQDVAGPSACAGSAEGGPSLLTVRWRRRRRRRSRRARGWRHRTTGPRACRGRRRVRRCRA